jgi:hypothetical protein
MRNVGTSERWNNRTVERKTKMSSALSILTSALGCCWHERMFGVVQFSCGADTTIIMKKPFLPILASFIAAAALMQPALAQDNTPLSPQSSNALTPRAFVPVILNGQGQSGSCSTTSSASFDLIGVQGGFYKDNRLTDENADFRLSIIGYTSTPTSTGAPLTLVDYNGATDPDAPKLHGIFAPNRIPTFVKNYQRYDWNWNESAPPPYGSRGGVNTQWPVSVLDMATTKGEAIQIPERSAANSTAGTNAMVLYADEHQITLVYGDQDRVDAGYVVYLANFCVDPNLVAAYRAQLKDGKRSTGKLPALRNDQKIGEAEGSVITVAVRDLGPFLDPRSRKDWWAQ